MCSRRGGEGGGKAAGGGRRTGRENVTKVTVGVQRWRGGGGSSDRDYRAS